MYNYKHQFYQANCIRAKLWHAQNQYNKNISKNETKEDQDSTGISPRDCRKVTLSSFISFCHLSTGSRVEPRPAGLLPTRSTPAWRDDLYHCCGNHGNQTFSRASDAPVPVAGPARGGLGCCRVNSFVCQVQSESVTAPANLNCPAAACFSIGRQSCATLPLQTPTSRRTTYNLNPFS